MRMISIIQFQNFGARKTEFKVQVKDGINWELPGNDTPNRVSLKALIFGIKYWKKRHSFEEKLRSDWVEDDFIPLRIWAIPWSQIIVKPRQNFDQVLTQHCRKIEFTAKVRVRLTWSWSYSIRRWGIFYISFIIVFPTFVPFFSPIILLSLHTEMTSHQIKQTQITGSWVRVTFTSRTGLTTIYWK